MGTELGAAGPSTPTDGEPKVSIERGHRRAEGEGPPTPRSHRPNVPGPPPPVHDTIVVRPPRAATLPPWVLSTGHST